MVVKVVPKYLKVIACFQLYAKVLSTEAFHWNNLKVAEKNIAVKKKLRGYIQRKLRVMDNIDSWVDLVLLSAGKNGQIGLHTWYHDVLEPACLLHCMFTKVEKNLSPVEVRLL